LCTWRRIFLLRPLPWTQLSVQHSLADNGSTHGRVCLLSSVQTIFKTSHCFRKLQQFGEDCSSVPLYALKICLKPSLSIGRLMLWWHALILGPVCNHQKQLASRECKWCQDDLRLQEARYLIESLRFLEVWTCRLKYIGLAVSSE
jgi:hypothetical protein